MLFGIPYCGRVNANTQGAWEGADKN
uniref:Uncharacterized protein n=1 Tax=Arundo donax TaxID=35708 RepID=A0A0A8Z7Q0_ARUDO